MRTQPLKSPRLLKKKRQRIIMRSVLVTCVVLAILFVPVLLLRLSFWTIQTISITGNAAVSEDSIRDVVRNEIQGTYFHLYSKSNIFLYPKSHIERTIRSQFSRISDVSVSMKSLKEIELNIVEQKPSALWCSEAHANCYFLNSEGFIFDQAPEFTDNVFVVFTGNTKENPIGQSYIPKEEFVKLNSLITEIRGLNLAIVSVDSLPDNDYAMVLATGETIFVTTRQDTDVTFSNLESVLNDPKLQLRKGDGLSVLSVDLRFGNKVFYKQKGK